MQTTPKTCAVFTRRLYKNTAIHKQTGYNYVLLKPNSSKSPEISRVFGWGRKPQALRARTYATKHDIPFSTLEDGFIHSMSQGRLGAASWSLVIDNQGIFYDAKVSSLLEKLINSLKLSPDQHSRTLKNINTIRKNGITKYNNAKLQIPDYIKQLRDPVLVVDQVKGDMSIPYALADKHSFDAMLATAIKENPNSDIIIKVHPDVIKGKRKGCISIPKVLPLNIHLLSDNLNPIKLLEHMNKVYVVSSQMGFEALLMGKKVTCFGAPFYAGWGLTDDRLDNTLNVFKRRNKDVALATIFYAAYHKYSHYLHPDTNEPCELEDILGHVVLQYRAWDRHLGKIYCIGFSPWKKRFINAYLKTPDNKVCFVKSAEEAIKKGFNHESISCLWSSRYELEAQKLNKSFGSPTWKVEDGFIRSVSLGSNYAPPASLVVDKTGLYFDPSKVSDLENILLNTQFNSEQLANAEKIKQQLIEQAISKYNVGERGTTQLFPAAQHKIKILVPGQVADDASIQKGCQDINSNLALLKAVRASQPDAYIIYKPHPDVLSGNRVGVLTELETSKHCDQVVTDISITDCLAQVNQVHTMTSLVGFEGLLRGLKVYCYGVPFYAGWQLTEDRHICERRKRKLSLNELIAGTICTYPLYMNWDTLQFTTPNHITNSIHKHLEEMKTFSKTNGAIPSKHFRKFNKKISLIKTMLRPRLK